MTARRLRVLIQRLPPESATMTAIRNAMTDEELAEQADKGEPEKAPWSQLEQLVAVVADRVAGLAYAYTAANTEKGKKKPTVPEPIRRPGGKQAKPKQKLSDEQANVLFEMLRERPL
ncbi:MAG TPA: hypothetical protein VM347_22825 [Nonomuraea sp.]|nr:hypothetical protein [Nonomuraea sp.]